MDAVDQILLLLKYGGAVSAAAYGLYATLTNFHEQREGKKVLTKKGYYGIALLMLSSLLSISADMLKDSRDREASRQAREELDRQHRVVIEDLKQASGNAVRAANPIKDISVSFCIRVPLQHEKLGGYRERLERDVPRLIQEGRLAVSYPYQRRSGEVLFRNDSPLFPTEAEPLAKDLLSLVGLYLVFNKTPVTSDDFGPRDLSIDLTDRFKDTSDKAVLRYGVEDRVLLLCRSYKVTDEYPQSSTGRIIAVPDLAASQLIVTLAAIYSRAPERDLRELRNEFEFDTLTLKMSGGRTFEIRGEELTKYQGASGLRYRYRFPTSIDR